MTARPVLWTAFMLTLLLGMFSVYVQTLDKLGERRYRIGYEAGYSAGLRVMPHLETRVIRGPTGPAWLIMECQDTQRAQRARGRLP